MLLLIQCLLGENEVPAFPTLFSLHQIVKKKGHVITLMFFQEKIELLKSWIFLF